MGLPTSPLSAMDESEVLEENGLPICGVVAWPVGAPIESLRAPGIEISSLFANGPSEGFAGLSGISLRSISNSSTGATSNPPDTHSGSLLGVASRISDRMISTAA